MRACLGETGLKAKFIHHTLPSSGGWETKVTNTKGEGFVTVQRDVLQKNIFQGLEYLRDVNPAGTVPVLIHNGHPVYESHEQIVYIDQVKKEG